MRKNFDPEKGRFGRARKNAALCEAWISPKKGEDRHCKFYSVGTGADGVGLCSRHWTLLQNGYPIRIRKFDSDAPALRLVGLSTGRSKRKGERSSDLILFA